MCVAGPWLTARARFASFGGILYGYDTGTISGIQTMPFWEKEFFPGLNSQYTLQQPGKLTTDSGEISLIVSILSVGTFIGALAAGFLADWTGRKWGLILSCLIPFNLGVLLQVAATETKLFIAGRVFAGLGVGLVSVQVPMYQSETLPKWIRGMVVGCYQLCITIGLLLASCINYGEIRDPSSQFSPTNLVSRNQEYQQQRRLPNPSGHPVRLVDYLVCWYVHPTRDTPISCKKGET